MGKVVADFALVPAEVWPAVLPRIRAASIEVDAGALERGVWWYACTRGEARVELGYCPDPGEVWVYSRARRFWGRPVSMYRLYRDVRRAVIAAGGKPA